MKVTLKQLAKELDAELVGDSTVEIIGISPVKAAGGDEITFISSARHIEALKVSKAGAVVVKERIADSDKPQLIAKNVDAALIKVLGFFAPKLTVAKAGIDPTAVVGKNVKIGKGASIGPLVVLADGVEIGDGTIVSSGCKVGENSKVGINSRLDSNVVVYHNCVIGNNVIIQSNSTIGSTGFGYYFVDGVHQLIPHNGGVIIEDFVEIGANCCVDRAKFGNTIIGAGTKMDNLVQIAHNCVIGKCCLMAAQVGIAGSTRIGDGVVFAGHSGASDNLEIGDRVMVGPKSAVLKDVAAGGKVTGSPAMDYMQAMRFYTLRGRLPEMARQLKQLSKKVEELGTAKDNQG